MVVKLIYRIRKEHSYERKLLKVHCESKEYTAWSDTAFCVILPGSALLFMSYLQTIRQPVTWTQSRPNWDMIVLSYKRKINLEMKYFFVK